MEKIRPILRPPTEGTHFTIAEARAALRELRREARVSTNKKTSARRKVNVKNG